MWLTLNTNEIRINDGMINMTNMWKACGGERTKAPNFWINQDNNAEFIQMVGEKNATVDCIKTRIGRNGGTFAHPVIGLAYAKYLSPKFHIWCNERLLASS